MRGMVSFLIVLTMIILPTRLPVAGERLSRSLCI